MPKGCLLQKRIKTLVVVGVGLMGGSFAMALKQAGLVERVVGVDHAIENLHDALRLGVIDEAMQDLTEAIPGAEVVMLATPVGQMASIFQAMVPILGADTIVTDVGSTKGNVVALFRQYLSNHLSYCLPAHPIAGSELSGVLAARHDLYDQRHVVFTPFIETRVEVIQVLSTLWEAMGAVVQVMSVAEHDKLFAAVSHLPHLLAFIYVNKILDKDHAQRYFDVAATGFRDFTRLAGSSPEVWRDIALANRDALLTELNEFQLQLDRLVQMLKAEDASGIQCFLKRANQARCTWYQRFLDNHLD